VKPKPLTTAPLDAWFYRTLALRQELERTALSNVVRWEWLKGIWCPHDPQPYGGMPSGFAPARPVKKEPAASATARNGHFHCGLDADGRLRIQRQYSRNKKPYVNVYLYAPGRIRFVRFGDEHSSSPVQCTGEFVLDGADRVVERRSYANVFSFPTRLTSAAISAHQKASTASRLRHRYVWKGEVLHHVDVETSRGKWALESTFEYEENGKLLRIWRPYLERRQQMWPRQKML
jgi:hypothetical protein